MENIVNFIKSFKNIFIYLILLSIFSFYIKEEAAVLLIITVILVLINSDLFKNKDADFKKNFKKYLLLIIKYWLIGAALMYISNTIINSFTHTIAENEVVNRESLNNDLVNSLSSMIVIAPLCEEIMFRGSFKNSLKNKYIFCLFTAFLFGLTHVIFSDDIIYIIPYALFGYYLAKLYYETDNIYNSIIMHMWHNLVCIIIILLGAVL